MDKKELVGILNAQISNLEALSKFIETLKSIEPWFQSSTVQNWVTLKISTQYLRDSLKQLKCDIK